MYIHYSIGDNSGLRTYARIVEVSVIGRVHFRRFHCIKHNMTTQKCTSSIHEQIIALSVIIEASGYVL